MTHSDNRADREPSADLDLALQLRERERELESLMGHLPGLAYRALAAEHWAALFASKGVEDLTGATRPTNSRPAGSTTPTSCCSEDPTVSDPRGRASPPCRAEDVRG